MFGERFLTIFVFCFMVHSTYSASSEVETVATRPQLETTTTCDYVLHVIKIREDDGCTGEYLGASCAGLCPSYEIPLFHKDRYELNEIEDHGLQSSYTACDATIVGYSNVTVPMTCPGVKEKVPREFVRPSLGYCKCVDKQFQQI